MPENKNVDFYGKVAKFPKNVKASHAYNFLDNIKISKKKIWYIMVEKQDNELQMIKYNNSQGFNMVKFIETLKEYELKLEKKWQTDFQSCLDAADTL